jgi:hypothetical protein
MSPHTKTAGDGQNDQSQSKTIKKTRRDPQPTRAPTPGGSPNGTVPKTLGEENRCQDRQTNADPQQ